MHVSTRSCQGGTISFVHDASMCQCCVHTNLYYTIFRPALARLKKLNNCSSSSDDYEMCGILTFLEGCLQYGFISDDSKSDILSNGIPPDYTPLLDSIVNAKKNFKSKSPHSASIRALLYKYKKKAVKTNETKLSFLKRDFDNCFIDSTSALPCNDGKNATKTNETKRRVSKRHFDDCLMDPASALLNKRTRTTLKTNETKQSAPKRHLRKCLKNSTPALRNKHKNALKTSKTKQSSSKRRLNSFKDPTSALLCEHKKKARKTNVTKQSSTAGKRKSKTPKPKSKKTVADKIPTKGTLKRKRWFVKQMETEENYEDDIFEDCPIYQLAKFDETSQSSIDYSNRGGTPTWEFKLSPRPDSPLPSFDDGDNISELKMSRKDAEEYQHRRRKRRRERATKIVPQSTSSEEVKAEDQSASLAEDQSASLAEDRSASLAVDQSASLTVDQSASWAQPSCSYATLKPPLKDEDDYDSEEIPDDYFKDSEDERDGCPNS